MAALGGESRLSLAHGQWVRGSYRILGEYIQPVTDRPTEPYALEEARIASKVRKKAATPAGDLLLLDPRDDAAVEAFVNRWGLLGLLLNERWIHVAFWKRGSFASRLYPLCEDLNTQAMSFLESRWDGERYESLFFPQGLSRGAALWRQLSEPVCLFRRAAGEYQAAAQLAARWLRRRTQPPPPNLMRTLREHTLAVHPELLVTRALSGEFEAAIVLPYPSLLAFCYGQLQRDLAGGSLGLCANVNCGRAFSSRRPNHDYCSLDCRNAQRSRRHRARARSAA